MKTEEKKELIQRSGPAMSGSMPHICRDNLALVAEYDLLQCKYCGSTFREPTAPKVKVSEEITDTMRIDWLEKGHAIVGLATGENRDKTMFCANFHEQNWEKHETVREAIDAAMKKKKNENQSTKEAAN